MNKIEFLKKNYLRSYFINKNTVFLQRDPFEKMLIITNLRFLQEKKGSIRKVQVHERLPED